MLKSDANNLVKKARYQLVFVRLVTGSFFTILVILGPNIIGLSMILLNSIFLILISALKPRGYLLTVKPTLKGYRLALVWLLAFLLWGALAAGILSELIFIISAYMFGTLITIYQFINIREENIETKCNTQSGS